MPFISSRLTNTIRNNPKHNPFDLDFEVEDLKNEENWSSEELPFIKLFDDFNNALNTGFYQSQNTLKDCVFPPNELINGLFAKANKHNLIVQGKIRRKLAHSEDSAFEMERLQFSEIDDYLGNPQNAVQSVEYLGEIIGLILTYQEKYDFLSVDHEPAKPPGKYELDIVLQYLINIFNIIFNLRIAYHFIVYKKVEVVWETEKSIKLGSDPLALDMIATINHMRYMNQFNEVFFTMSKVIKKQKKPRKIIDRIKVDKGELHIELTNGDIDLAGTAKVLATSGVFYPHLANFKFKALDDLNIDQLLLLLEKLSEIIDFQYYENTDVNTELDMVPQRIRLSNLEIYLSETAEVPLAAASKFLETLLHPVDKTVDFFKYPLYLKDGYVHFLHATLAAPLPTAFVDRWLSVSGLDQNNQSKLFADHVQSSLKNASNKLPYDVRWDVLDRPELFSENVVLVETKEHIIILTCQTLAFTGDSREETEVLEIYHQLFASFLAEVEAFSQNQENTLKKILPLCITSNIHYAGYTIHGLVVLDLILFKNYFSIGKYSKVKVINDPSSAVIKELYEHEYYQSQTEFEHNLINFLLRPYPLHVMLEKLVYKEIPMLPPQSELSLRQHTVDIISVEQENIQDLGALEHMLSKQFFINKKDPKADMAINGLLTKIFNRIGDRMIRDSEIIPKLSDAIARSKRITAVHLVVYIQSLAQRLHAIKTVQGTKFRYENFDGKIAEILDRCMDRLGEQPLRLSAIEIDLKISEEDRRKLMSFLISVQANLAHRKYSPEAEKEIMLQLIIFRALVRDQPDKAMLFTMIGNFVENLNFNHKFQTARELAEESWLLGIRLDCRIDALNILFKCYFKQKNFLQAGIYGGILLSAVDSLLTIDQRLFTDVLYSLLRYFREFGYREFGKSIWKTAMKQKLETYDEQKFNIAYFNLRLSAGLKEDLTLSGAVIKYLEKNLQKIITFGDQGTAPWLVLCINIQQLAKEGNLNVSEKLKSFRRALERSITEQSVLKTIKMQVGGDTDSPKEEFIEALIQVYSAEYFENFKYDILNMRPLADKMFQKGLKDMDLDILLLTSLVYNDQSLRFYDQGPGGDTKIFGNNPKRLDPKVLSAYSFYVMDQLELKKGQVLLWLVELRGQVYFLRINSDRRIYFTVLPDWNLYAMDDWTLKSLPKFYFNSKKNPYYDMAEQEAYYKQLLQSLSGFDLQMDDDFEELLLLKSVDMAAFPDNLIINKAAFVSANKPICNILNLEHYIANHKPKYISTTINAWLPKSGQDGTISFGHDELLPLLTEKKAQITDTILLEGMPDADINIFLAHGHLGTDGFNSFQSDKKNIQFSPSAFGSGNVAILFICNSGNLKEDFHSQDVRSLAQDLIAQGYDAVIAPFWKYDVTMASLWLKEFFQSFDDGYSISQSVHLSNRQVAQYDQNTARMFIDPAGWAAMHLYGNPNIYLEVKK